MQYLASCHWQSANENSPSLLLHQVYHKQKALPVLMACVCSHDRTSMLEKRMVTGLTDWFYETGLFLVDRKGERGISTIGRKLECYLNQSQNIMEGIRLSGVFCVGNFLFLWKQGGGKIWLMNQKNGKDNITEWYPEPADGRLVFQKGFVQREVGILVSTNALTQPEPVNVKACKDREGVKKCLEKMETEVAILLITK